MTREFKIFHKIDTVHGLCEACKEEALADLDKDSDECLSCQ